jgi:hypothetical protein
MINIIIGYHRLLLLTNMLTRIVILLFDLLFLVESQWNVGNVAYSMSPMSLQRSSDPLWLQTSGYP